MPRIKNPQIKKANTEQEYTHEHVVELQKCAKNPFYFIDNYVVIQHPVEGIIPFKLRDYQKRIMQCYAENRFSIVLSPRQIGKSVLSAAYLYWYAAFTFDKTILIASYKNDHAMEMIYRIKQIYENLPHWLKPGVMEDGWNKHSVSFDNGSRILSEATSATSGRGFSISMLYLDEFAFVAPNIQEEFWVSISPTLSTGGNCIITSTPNGDNNIFAELWRGAQTNSNGFAYVRTYWDEVPGRDEEWKKSEIARIGERQFRQEQECEFLSSEALLIDTITLMRLDREVKQYRPLFNIRGVDFYEEIKQGKTYLVGVDPATGTGSDFSTIIVFEFPSLQQVAEYRSNTTSTNDLFAVLKNIIKLAGQSSAMVYFSIENNGIGEGLISLYEADEDFPENALFISEDGKKRRGMVTTSRSKLKACVNLREMIERNGIIIKSKMIIEELKTYVKKGGAYAAQRGSTDDLVAALLIIIRLLQELAAYEDAAYEKLYNAEYEEWDEEDKEEYDEDDLPMPISLM